MTAEGISVFLQNSPGYTISSNFRKRKPRGLAYDYEHNKLFYNIYAILVSTMLSWLVWLAMQMEVPTCNAVISLASLGSPTKEKAVDGCSCWGPILFFSATFHLPTCSSVTLITSLQICKINFCQIRYLACGKTFIAEEIKFPAFDASFEDWNIGVRDSRDRLCEFTPYFSADAAAASR